jgi:tryptophanyl-tRNA synthetase
MLKNAASKVIFSGIQPTGTPHLGNYLGALHNWVQLQRTTDATIYYSIVDLHAITMPQNPATLRQAKLDMAKSLLACGIDPKRSVLFEQSKVKEHAELQWIFNCITPVGWLSRMTQWKVKTMKKKKSHELSNTLGQALNFIIIYFYGLYLFFLVHFLIGWFSYLC